jgi:hypothetical protein
MDQPALVMAIEVQPAALLDVTTVPIPGVWQLTNNARVQLEIGSSPMVPMKGSRGQVIFSLKTALPSRSVPLGPGR